MDGFWNVFAQLGEKDKIEEGWPCKTICVFAGKFIKDMRICVLPTISYQKM